MMNRVTLIGRLGKDPEKRVLESGAPYVRFSLATDESYKDAQGNWQDQTEWHNVIMWRDMADRAERQLKQGYLIYVEGKLTYRSWKDQEGHEHHITEIRANSYRLLKRTMKDEIAAYNQGQMQEPSGLPNAQAYQQTAPTGPVETVVVDRTQVAQVEEDDLPF